MAWMAAAALVGSAVIGGTASYFGNQRSNETNTANVAASNAMTDRQAHAARIHDQDMFNSNVKVNRENAQWQYERGIENFQRTSNFANEQALQQMAFQREQQNSAQSFNAQQAEDQRSWQRMMSDTSYQRGMADMRAAGLNPMLAYSQGGAPIGSGATASVSPSPGAMGSSPPPGAPSVQGGSGSLGGTPTYRSAQVANVLGPAVSTAMQGARFMQELEQMRANVRATDAQTIKTLAETQSVKTHSAESAARTITEGARPSLVRAQTGAATGQEAAAYGASAQAHASAGERRAAEEQTRQQTEFGRRYGPGGTDPRGIAGFWEQSGRRAEGPVESFVERWRRNAESGPRIGPHGALGDALPGITSFFGRVGEWIDRQMRVSPATRENLIRMHHTVR